MSGYIGPIPVPQGIQNKESFTATASQTTFNTNGYTDGAFINVYLNGVRLINGTDYTATNGSDIVLTTGASADDVLDFETFNSFSLASQQFENITTKNPTHEDTDGGRESALSFQGEQSGGEISTLAAIQASHDGTADDQKGDLIFKTNDGSDNNAPTERLRIDSNGSILTATLGTDNVHLGEGAGDSIASGGNNNVTIGKDAGTALTTGDNNTAIGYEALKTEDGHGNNVAVGYQSLKTQNAGANAGNTAVGYQAGLDLTTAHSSTFVGTLAGASVTDGNHNTLFGYNAGGSITSGEKNIAIGSAALDANTTGDQNVAIGNSALGAMNITDGSASYNTAVGADAGKSITTGTSNTLLGGQAGDVLTVGHYNIAIGHGALGADVEGSRSVAIGWEALNDQSFSSATISYNTAVGHEAGKAVTTGTNNTLLGYESGKLIETGYDNTFLGVLAGASTTTNYSNTFVGKTSGQLTTGHSNTYLGRYDGNQDSVDIRSYNNMIVLSDGAGSVKQIYWSLDGSMYMRQQLRPWANNSYNLGGASNKWAEFFCNNSTINTSDENEKQQVASLTSAEITAATAISKLFKTYKWNSAVETKGDDARTHTGVVAQQVKAAMTDAGLDASKYAFWCSDTWWTKDREVEAVEADEELGIEAKDAYTFMDKWEKEEDAPEGATKHTVTGVRYAELLAFVSAATEQRLTSIESRLTALEAE